jgi:peptidoglycan/xylan/chitin deacetylase (PgdA/CDA1 family)
MGVTHRFTGWRDWSPSRFVQGSIAFQLGGWPLALSGIIASPLLIEALILNHGVLFAASLRPQDTLLGPNLVRLPACCAAHGEIALTFDDGPDPAVTPAVLDLLDVHGVSASFFCVGERARRHAALTREIAARGHRVENHSDRHHNLFAFQGPVTVRDEIRRAQETLAELTGRAPVFFRAPFGIRNPWLAPALRQLGLRLVSWTRRGYDGVLKEPDHVLSLLLSGLAAGDIVLMHDGYCPRDRQGRPVILGVLPRMLDAIATRQLRVSLLDPQALSLPNA